MRGVVDSALRGFTSWKGQGMEKLWTRDVGLAQDLQGIHRDLTESPGNC